MGFRFDVCFEPFLMTAKLIARGKEMDFDFSIVYLDRYCIDIAPVKYLFPLCFLSDGLDGPFFYCGAALRPRGAAAPAPQPAPAPPQPVPR